MEPKMNRCLWRRWPAWRGVVALCAGVLAFAGGMENSTAQTYEFIAQWGTFGAGTGQFDFPQGIAVDGTGNVYVVESNGNRVQKFTSAGIFLQQWGGDPEGEIQFLLPTGIAVANNGMVFVVDTFNSRVQKFTVEGIFLGQWGSNGQGNGQFSFPTHIAPDNVGGVYVVDSQNNRVQKFTEDGIFEFAWGTLGEGEGEFDRPWGIAVDSAGNVYVSDALNNRVQKFSPLGVFLTQWGTQETGSGRMFSPRGIAVDAEDNVFVSNFSNAIQKFSASGEFITQWGGDGAGPGQFNVPMDVAVAPSGDVYVADERNHRVQHFGLRPGENCALPCLLAGRDSDGDGLTDACETCIGTNPLNPDTNGDGMPDGWKVRHGLDPLRDDSGEDPDGDGLTNLEEFLQGSSPIDPNDPAPSYFVSPAGLDVPSGGTRAQPWATLGFALTQIPAAETAPARLIIAVGLYEEDLALAPYVTLAAARGADVLIRGALVGAEGAALVDVALEAVADADVLLDLRGLPPGFPGVFMTISGVRFTGTASGRGIGILMGGDASEGVLIEACTFSQLDVGLEIAGPLPLLRRCYFEFMRQAAIIVRALPGKSGSLGEGANPQSGWNTFDLASFEGAAIINERDETLIMEANDWLTDDAAAIDSFMVGDVKFTPFLTAGSGLLASALFCTVWDARDQTPITTASVDARVSGYAPVTQNVNGLYAFPVIADGAYTVQVTAAGFATANINVSLAPGETRSLIAALAPPGGPGPGPGPGCCNRNARDGFPGGEALLIGLLVLAALVMDPFYRQRG